MAESPELTDFVMRNPMPIPIRSGNEAAGSFFIQSNPSGCPGRGNFIRGIVSFVAYHDGPAPCGCGVSPQAVCWMRPASSLS
jgi:hypothetical protein